jgi:hypothetical protein
MAAPSDEPVILSSVRRGPLGAREPAAPSRLWSMYEPASAPTWAPMAAPVRVAPRMVTPAGSSALPTAAPATARARVAIFLRVGDEG